MRRGRHPAGRIRTKPLTSGRPSPDRHCLSIHREISGATMSNAELHSLIETAWERRTELSPGSDRKVADAVDQVLAGLDDGTLRVAEKTGSEWVVHQWVKKAVLLSFRLQDNVVMDAGAMKFYDKVDSKFAGYDAKAFADGGFRVVPAATVRRGAYLGKNVVVMPSFVNIGAHVGDGTMVDTWATVGSCAQVGKNVHLSGGVGLGGVLEPVQAAPVIIEDNAFIGSRCIIVEGVRVGREAVLGANVVLTASSKVIDVTGPDPVEYKGYVPERSVVIPGSYPKTFPAGTFHVPCALIIGQRKESTDKKTSLNNALRDNSVSV